MMKMTELNTGIIGSLQSWRHGNIDPGFPFHVMIYCQQYHLSGEISQNSIQLPMFVKHNGVKLMAWNMTILIILWHKN